MIVALISIPFLVRRMGAERFGVLSFAWTILGSFVIFDLGLGRATIKFVAESLGSKGLEGLPKVVWTSVWSQLFLGIVGAVLMGCLTRFLVTHFLKISSDLEGETAIVFLMLSASLPVLMVGAALRGVLEAGQYFAVVNIIKIPTNASLFLLPALGVAFDLQLTAIVLLLIGSRVFTLGAYLFCCLRYFPGLRTYRSFNFALFRSLLTFGSWVTIANVIPPLLSQIDRFFIGSIASMTAVGYYAAPFEAISRAWVIPGSLTATLFPAFASLEASGSRRRINELCARSVKSLLLILTPILLLITIFSHDILRLWLGSDFAVQSSLVLQILASGVMLNGLGLIPFSLLQGIGRPDLTAKFLLLELPLYVGALWFLVKNMGLPGAALAYTLRALVDTILLFAAARWLKSASFRSFVEIGARRTLLAIFVLGGSLIALMLMHGSLMLRALLASFLMILFGFVTWVYLLDATEKELLLVATTQLRSAWGKVL
jgi:O-antigen/teichoic acid export membrane protein